MSTTDDDGPRSFEELIAAGVITRDQAVAIVRDLIALERDRGAEIDPDDERDWFDLTYGYAIGRYNVSAEIACACAVEARYHEERYS